MFAKGDFPSLGRAIERWRSPEEIEIPVSRRLKGRASIVGADFAASTIDKKTVEFAVAFNFADTEESLGIAAYSVAIRIIPSSVSPSPIAGTLGRFSVENPQKRGGNANFQKS